ncbi:hypothetical protein K505DRAFT_238574 [Melanomma pulvis-pyrius CBS 109.77]|uniref:DUF8004 domain-containing protein n=1 Tax=Melanomma pulvis-pyrius CBS 109.77 TaxID=1314802 RepID=A0A6A6XI58_9PLEO|nr:hypothetical protein K505DRAFT_238574 [Melanomma pulvis-pyrius CBS 109.77]
MKDIPREFLNNEPSTLLSFRHSSASTPSSARIQTRSTSYRVPQRNAMPAARVKRWAGLTRTVSDWDGLRKDPELWFEDGDCLVHLYARGQSQRGPSFCVPFNALRRSKCGAMFSLCFAQMTASSPTVRDSRRGSSICNAPTSVTNFIELYIPAPEDSSRETSFNWHLTTRNFFAFVFGKPLVGRHMGQAMVELQERMHLFRSGRINNHQDFLEYAEDQGYRDFVECTDYALALLYYAEHYKLRGAWIDAFAHCVGMNDTLNLSPEFEPISRLTKALITRSYLDMDIQLDRVMLAVSNFLEDDLSPAFLGLSDGGRMHLDRFRSFLHGFYVEKFGYWPPPKDSSFSKALYKSMYFDFKYLYDYLVDLESTADISSQKPASGGICVLQNVESFDKRHRFTALPHPLPLLPEHVPMKKRTQSQKTLRALTLGSKQAKTERYMTTRAALTLATNSRDITVTSCPLVQSYMRFERQCALNQRDEKVKMADARKIRWLLVYGTLQYLISAIRAPKEVRDTEGPTYPLCCLVTEKSPWQIGVKALTAPAVATVNVPEAINTYLSESGCDSSDNTPKALTIQPDCQTGEYFTHTNPDATPMASRPVSVEIPSPLRLSSPTRNSSVRSFRRLSFSSLGSWKNTVVLKTPAQPYCEILVHGYGNGLNETIVDPPSQTVSRSGSIIISNRSSKSVLPASCGAETSWLRPLTPDSASHSRRPSHLQLHCDLVVDQKRTPVLDSFEVDHLVSPITPAEDQKVSSSYDSSTSLDSPFWSDEASTSSKSSTSGEHLERKESSIGDGGLLGGFVAHGTPSPSPRKSSLSPGTATPTTPYRHGEFRFSFNTQRVELTQLSGSPTSADVVDSSTDIGVALSLPLPSPQLPQRTSPSSEILPLAQRPKPLSKSFSTDSLASSSYLEPLSPLRMNPLEPTSKEGAMDIYSALTLSPEDDDHGESASRAGSESTRSILDAIPPPIPKVSSKRMQKLIDEEERSRKKERRKSFWRR